MRARMQEIGDLLMMQMNNEHFFVPSHDDIMFDL